MAPLTEQEQRELGKLLRHRGDKLDPQSVPAPSPARRRHTELAIIATAAGSPPAQCGATYKKAPSGLTTRQLDWGSDRHKALRSLNLWSK